MISDNLLNSIAEEVLSFMASCLIEALPDDEEKSSLLSESAKIRSISNDIAANMPDLLDRLIHYGLNPVIMDVSIAKALRSMEEYEIGDVPC